MTASDVSMRGQSEVVWGYVTVRVNVVTIELVLKHLFISMESLTSRNKRKKHQCLLKIHCWTKVAAFIYF